MKAEGQAGDHGTNCSNTQEEVVELEVEFMIQLLLGVYKGSEYCNALENISEC
jgi:hypothetical protein